MSAREPERPSEHGDVTLAALHARVAAALREAGGESDGAAPTPELCLAAGERLLDAALAGDERSRATAVDLLAADALVTRAFELAAGRPDLERLAESAMRRIAAHAAGGRPA